MLYGIYEIDGEQDGRVVQANKIWHKDDADEKFEQGLRDFGQRFVKIASAYVLSAEDYYVDVKAEELIERPVMPIEMSASHLKAGTGDYVLLTGVPASAHWRVMAGGAEYDSGRLDPDGKEIQFLAPVPATYTIVLERWPYRTFLTKIEAHA